MKILEPRWFATVAMITMVMISGCNSQDENDQFKAETSIQLKWVHQAQFAGFYMAQEEGLYKSQGLQVDIVKGGPGINKMDRLKDGKTDFAVVGAEEVVKARENGISAVAIAAIYRRNPTIFMTHPDSGIEHPKDFPGHSITLADTEDRLFAKLMLESFSLSIDSLPVKTYDYKYQSLIDREVDITSGYMIGGYLRLKRKGFHANVIWPDDYGVHFYGDVLVTTENFLKKNRETVNRFLKASLEGWKIALQNQTKGVEVTMKYALESDPELQKEMLSQSFPLIETGEDQIGWMRPEIWDSMIENISSAEQIPKEKFIKPIFDMGPLHQAYKK